MPDVNGALVGGASLKADDFYGIIDVYRARERRVTTPKNSYGDGAWQIRQSWPLWPLIVGRGDTFPKP